MDPVPEQGASVDLEALLDRLRQRVEARRAAGEYPPGLEDDLDSHFRRVVATRPPRFDEARLAAPLGAARAAASFSVRAIDYTSRWRGVPLVHRAVGTAVGRQTAGVLAQAQRFAESVVAALDAMAAALRDGSTHVHHDLVEQIDGLLDRDVARPTTVPDAASERLAQVLQATAGPAALVTGPRPSRLGATVRSSPVEVLHADGAAAAWLSGRAAGSLGAVVAAGAVEAWDEAELAAFLEAAAEALVPSGALVIDATGATSPVTFAEACAIASRSLRCVAPEEIEAVARRAGFRAVDVVAGATGSLTVFASR